MSKNVFNTLSIVVAQLVGNQQMIPSSRVKIHLLLNSWLNSFISMPGPLAVAQMVEQSTNNPKFKS
jgi:hypothetical protein